MYKMGNLKERTMEVRRREETEYNSKSNRH